MNLRYVPKPGAVLLCDYSTGFVPPEMVKRRPVVVLTPRMRYPPAVYIVVPLSTRPPRVPTPIVHRIVCGTYPFLTADRDVWAKCDMIAAVSPTRLGRLWLPPGAETPRLSRADLNAIQGGVLHALGLGRLTSAL